MIICKRPAPIDYHLQETGSLRTIICNHENGMKDAFLKDEIKCVLSIKE